MQISPKVAVLTTISICLTFILHCNKVQNKNGDINKSDPPKKEMQTYAHTNKLIDQSSPYLLQHAHNPVNWYPWGDEALAKAHNENKLLIISVGYAACHWCHVMEHESFEKEDTAKIMNDNFISIKVDREERPDIDQIYMQAAQMMTGRGGWPLNCIALPDGKPFFGGTYFPKDQWEELLLKVSAVFKQDPGRLKDYAERVTQGIVQESVIQVNNTDPEFNMELIEEAIKSWKTSLDRVEGGNNQSIKFPMPNNFEFLLHYSQLMGDSDLQAQVMLTLKKMAFGGIYDQIGGGFARYSTDAMWKVPHFEKMLYDNAQLVSLYSQAYQLTKNELYKQVVADTLDFVSRELTGEFGNFYSSLDADSEGEEGKYYVWQESELESILGDDYALFADYFNVNQIGKWEDDKYILLRKKSDSQIAQEYGKSVVEITESIKNCKEKLFQVRDRRVHPGLDDKGLTSWNSLMIKGYVDAYNAFNNAEYLKAAEKTAHLLLTKVRKSDGGLWRNFKGGKASINAYLEDYSFSIEALIALYQATFDEKWLNEANSLMQYSIKHFFDAKSGMFYFTSDLDPKLIARKLDLRDNVIPSSNSSIAKGLFLLGNYFDNQDYISKANFMLNNVKKNIATYGSERSNWAILFLNVASTYYEIAIVGEDSINLNKELNQYYIPNRLVVGSSNKSSLPLLENKYLKDKTMVYVCVDKMCKVPVTDIPSAIKQIGI